MKTQILIMRPGQRHERREVEIPDDPSEVLAALRTIVEPITEGRMEHVTVLSDFEDGVNYKRADMFVHEEGHVLVPPLPRNEAATAIYRRNGIMNHGVTNPETLPWIAGPAVLFEHIVWK